jgi:TP901 family phage tail tape measure protein
MAKRISKEDATGEFPRALDELIAKFGSLETAISANDELIKRFKGDIGKLRKEIQSIDLGTVKGVKEFNQKQVEAQKIMLTTAKLEEQNVKLLQQKEKLKQQELRTQKLVNQESKKTLTAYQQESRALTEMRNRYKDLAVQKMSGVKLTKEEEKEFRRLVPQIRQTDEALKRIDASAGQFQRNVGNYPKVLGGVRNALGQLGIAFGAGAFISSAKDVVVEFDNAIADLSAITGATGKDLDFFKKNAIALGVEVKGGASAVVEAYKLIASAKPELLENAEALNSVTESAILLAKASGMELPAAATALTDAMNQFGADADQAAKFVDVLAAGAKFGSAEIPQITDALLRFGAVAKTSNVNIQESTALIEDLAEKGLKGADAGTALRNVMLKLSAPDALPKDAQIRLKQLGVNFDELKDKSKPFAERLESLKPLLNDNAALVKVFGTENAVAATTLLSTTARIKELTAQVDENNIAQEQADARSKTLSESYNRFKETLNGLILEFVDGKDASAGLANALDFLRENIGTVLTVAKQGIKAWITYKAVMTALNLKQSFTDWKNLGGGIKNVASNLKEGQSAGQKFGQAMKGIGWTALISLALELGSELYHIASGAAQAEENMARLQKTSDRALKSTSKNIQQITGNLEDRLRVIQNMLTSGEIKSEKEANKLRAEAVKQTEKELYLNAKLVQSRRIRYYDLRAEVREIDKKIKSDQKSGKSTEGLYKRLKEIQQELKITGDEAYFGLIQEDATAIDIIAQLDANIRATQKSSAEYYKELKNVTNQTEELDANQKSLVISTGKVTKAKKEQVKAYKDANDQIERMNALLKETQDLTDEIALFESEQNLQDAIESQTESIEQSGQYSLDIINARIQAEYDLRKAIIERQFVEQVDVATNEQEVINARIRRDFELGKLDEEFVNKKKEVNKQLEDAQEAHAEEISKSVTENAQRNYDNERKWIELTTKYLEDQIDKRIALLDKESEAHQKQQDYFRALAESGNINAQQSLAEEARLQREAEAEKAKLERRKQYIKVVSAFLTEYTNRIEKGESSTQAFTGALASKAAMEALIESLPAFYEGTESTGKVANPLDNNGGRLSVLHDDERVMTAKQNKPLLDMGLSNEDVVKYAQKGVIADSIVKGNTSGKSWDIAPLLKKLDNVEKAIQNMPQTDYQYDQAIRGLFSVIKTEKRGNTTTRTETQYRKR